MPHTFFSCTPISFVKTIYIDGYTSRTSSTLLLGFIENFPAETRLTYRETEVRASRSERSYVSTPNKNSFDIQIASTSFFRRLVFVREDCADFASRGLSQREENL